MKELPKVAARDLIDHNHARIRSGLPMIIMKIRTCLKCQERFESSGDRVCKDCHRKLKVTAVISGVELI